MSNNNNFNFNFTSPPPWSQPDRRLGREYGFNPRPGPSQPPAATIDETRGAYFDPWGTRDDLFVTGPLGLIGLMQPNTLPLFDDYTTSTNESRLSQDEQTKALKKLRKEIYNPTPKRLSSRLCLYYRDQALDVVNERAKGKEEEDEKNCAVCLEDFEPKEMVMVTPCNHMFHEDCIVPWIKSHGQCPVCRFVLSAGEGSGRGRRTEPIAGTFNNNNIPNLPSNSNRLLSPDLISFLRSIGAI